MLFFKQWPVSYNTPYEKIGDEVRSLADEVPFDIPDSWEWVRVRNCTELFNGRAFKPSDWTVMGLPIVRIQNLNDEKAPFNYYDKSVEEDVHCMVVNFSLHGLGLQEHPSALIYGGIRRRF